MIIQKEVEDILKQIPGTLYGQAINAYLTQARDELDSVTKITTFEELLGKQYAIKVIDELFKFMDNKKVETKNKNQYI